MGVVQHSVSMHQFRIRLCDHLQGRSCSEGLMKLCIAAEPVLEAKPWQKDECYKSNFAHQLFLRDQNILCPSATCTCKVHDVSTATLV